MIPIRLQKITKLPSDVSPNHRARLINDKNSFNISTFYYFQTPPPILRCYFVYILLIYFQRQCYFQPLDHAPLKSLSSLEENDKTDHNIVNRLRVKLLLKTLLLPHLSSSLSITPQTLLCLFHSLITFCEVLFYFKLFSPLS